MPNRLSRGFAIIVIVAVCLIGWIVAPLWSRAGTGTPGGSGPARMTPSDVVADAFFETLCRPPRDDETFQWETRPFAKPELLGELTSTSESQRVREIRQVYLEVLRRDPFEGDCAAVRGWVDGPHSVEDIERRIAESFEARRVREVRQIVIETLGRDPVGWDNATLQRWVQSGYTPAEIKGRLAAQRPLVGVHYFTWYRSDQGRWGNGATYVQADAPKPSLGWYASSNPAAMDAHIEQMAAAGFDFVIVHVIAESPETWANAHTFFSRLAGRRLRAAVMLDGRYAGTSAATRAWIEKVKAEFTNHANYFSLQRDPLIMLFSIRLHVTVPGVVLRNVYWTPEYAQERNTFNVDRRLYPRDWPFWAEPPQDVINGVVPVVPGYDDTHLGRTRRMEFPRNNGQMYHEQWQRALALRPEAILVYGWNEHFEQTAIEPTEAWGDRYLQLSACYIAHAHAGTTGACP